MDIYRCTFHWGLLLTGPNKIELFYGVIVQETSHIQVFPDVPHTCLQADTTWSHEKRDREVESYPISLCSIHKKIGTRNIFVHVVCTDPLNNFFWFCENGGWDRFFVLCAIMLCRVTHAQWKSYLIRHFCKIKIFDLRDLCKLHVQMNS